MTNQRKTAFISGAGRNIGRAIALSLARDGFNVVVNGSTFGAACEETAAQARAHGVDAKVAMADVGDPAKIKKIGAGLIEEFGAIDVLVNNAAIRPFAPFLEMPEDQWDRVLSVDLHAAIHLSRAFLPGMVERGWGRIVNLTGMNAMHGYNGRAAVSVSKHGLWGLTKALGKEFGGKGVTVNAISPGPIDGDYGDEELGSHIQSQVKLIPVGHLGEPRHISSLTSYLCSDDGGFVNCQMIACNGGTQT